MSLAQLNIRDVTGGGDLVGRGCSIDFGDSGGPGGGRRRGNGSHGCLSALDFV
jgi:hypothetical protein